ncbi:polynucleotide adenylyltransferase PcnB [Candidatus Berkiella aquae]|uniref:Poly(A) polymerase I n=1 Tax=Candidatus Berkiella aquae TaxID=295108 RepID=A0A0Q9YT25_9GAMM|nr:polynucleotide adenylyltransferase PcnB [Candidatus Berkiella aquae]MCS5710211.1 polynucleotide adenylyltransferase PcnB [Candidatus Berkiella aquae]
MIRALIKKVGFLFGKAQPTTAKIGQPIVIPRSQHGISRKEISENALKVLYRLNKHGYEAYLVGGSVRDLLLGLHPKDFDVVTNAKPEEVRRVFRNCRLIGRRFRLAHVYFGHDIIEVATFRGKTDAPSEDISHSEQGMILRDNVYGTIAEDVWRRDFTINALYYNIADFSIVDYVGGFADLKAKRMRMIGDVKQRYREDPVRILRAVRFAAKANIELSKELTQPIAELKELLHHISSARLFEEVMKMFHSGVASRIYQELKTNGLLAELFPITDDSIKKNVHPMDALLGIVFQSTDNRIRAEKPVTPSFIVAALLWYPIVERTTALMEKGIPFIPARMQATEELLSQQAKRISIPKRITLGAREIWQLQMRLEKRHGKRAQQLISEQRFRAAYDFLEMRAQIGEDVNDLYEWWRAYIDGDAAIRKELLKKVNQPTGRRKRRKRKPAPT